MSQEGTLSTYLFYFNYKGIAWTLSGHRFHWPCCAVMGNSWLSWLIWLQGWDKAMKGEGRRCWDLLGFVGVVHWRTNLPVHQTKELTVYGGLAYVRVGLLIVEQQQQQSVAVRIYRTCIPHPSTNNKTWVQFHGSILYYRRTFPISATNCRVIN
jgi:hypothetical protein